MKTWQRNVLSYEHAEGPAVCMLMYVERERASKRVRHMHTGMIHVHIENNAMSTEQISWGPTAKQD